MVDDSCDCVFLQFYIITFGHEQILILPRIFRLLESATNAADGNTGRMSVDDCTRDSTNDWLTSGDLFAGGRESPKAQALKHGSGREYIEYGNIHDSPKRKMEPGEQMERKKPKIEMESCNDSGYSTPDVSQDLAQEEDVSIITENIGDVNMLNESLDLFNESITNVDLVNEMFQKIDVDNESQLQHLPDHMKSKPNLINVNQPPPNDVVTQDDIDVQDIIAALENYEANRKVPDAKPVKETAMRKIFRGPIQNFCPTFQVLSFKPSFKPYVYEVELSDGEERSKNFYFKSGASLLKENLMVQLKTMRHVGSKICVDTFQALDLREKAVGDPRHIEEDYFKELRRTKIDPMEIVEFESPKTILDYIVLEENIVAFIESCGFSSSDFHTSDNMDTRREILYNLLRRQQRFSPKMLKILSRLLRMEKEDLESFVTETVPKISASSHDVGLEHSYCNMYQTFK